MRAKAALAPPTVFPLNHWIKTLSPDQIQVVELSFFADKPHSQIAAELGIPLGTVKSRLRLAMARLKGAMGEAE